MQGWEPIMPTFKGQVNEEELIQLLAFIKSLKPGQTPVRTEEASAAAGCSESAARRQSQAAESRPDGKIKRFHRREHREKAKCSKAKKGIRFWCLVFSVFSVSLW